ncbi:hypothetical protein VCHA49P379_210064 [Vibrio chagasii]|nr:hypothetical protein VCHA49P379_210064 [Vibrio chagasii]
MRDASKRDAKRLGADANGGETSSERLKADSRQATEWRNDGVVGLLT